METTVRRFIADEAGVEPGSFEYMRRLARLMGEDGLTNVINELENEYEIVFFNKRNFLLQESVS